MTPKTHALGPQQRTISRRTLLAGIAASAALPVGLICVPAKAAPTTHTFTVGQFEVTVLSDGTLTLPISFAVPGRDPAEVKTLLEAGGLPGDAINAQVNVAIVKTPDAMILVDTGGGPDFMPTIGKLADQLEAAGIPPEKITHVIFTHAHADHLWGVIDPLDGGSRFTNARHVMTAAEYDFWSKPGRENEVPEFFKPMTIGTQRRLKAVGDRFEMKKAGDEIAAGVQLLDTAGHTPGHVSVLLHSGSEQLLIGGDALTHPLVSFANPGWRWGPDMEPEIAIATRKRLLQMLAAEKTPLLGYHLPWPGLGRVEVKDSAWRFVQS